MRLPLDELERRLESLTGDELSLSRRMRIIADALVEKGTPPSWEFVDELKFFRQRFGDLTQELFPDEDPAATQRLIDLKERLDRLQQRLSATRILETARSIRHVDPARDDISTQLADFVSRTEQARDEEHVAAAEAIQQLIALILDDGQLPDNAWESARQAIESTLGREISMAAIRGRLTINE